MPVNNMIRTDLKALGNVNTVFMLITPLGIMLQSPSTHFTRFFHWCQHTAKHISAPTNSDGRSLLFGPHGLDTGDVTNEQPLKCQIVVTHLKSIVSSVVKSCETRVHSKP